MNRVSLKHSHTIDKGMSMTTVAAPKIKAFDQNSLEKIAYNAVSSIPTREPNDQYRLGYSVWLFLKERKGTLALAVKNSGSRILVSESEAIATIRQELKNAGIDLSQ